MSTHSVQGQRMNTVPCTCVFHVCGGVRVRHGINVHKLLLEHGQQEGETVVQTNVQDELTERRRTFCSYKNIKMLL